MLFGATAYFLTGLSCGVRKMAGDFVAASSAALAAERRLYLARHEAKRNAGNSEKERG